MPLILAVRRPVPKKVRTPAKGYMGSHWPAWSLTIHHPPRFWSLRRALSRQVQPQVVPCGDENTSRWLCVQLCGPRPITTEQWFLTHRKGKIITSNNLLLLKQVLWNSDKGQIMPVGGYRKLLCPTVLEMNYTCLTSSTELLIKSEENYKIHTYS